MPARAPLNGLIQLPLSDDIWVQFVALHNLQGSAMSVTLTRPSAGVWLCSGNVLVAGVCIYETDGQFVLAEHLVANPLAPARLRLAAIRRMVLVVQAYATARSKWVIAHPSKPWLARFLRRFGYKVQNAATMSMPPGFVP